MLIRSFKTTPEGSISPSFAADEMNIARTLAADLLGRATMSDPTIAALPAPPERVAGDFPASFDLADLDGTNGFRIDGVANGDRCGVSVSSAGDVNGDGIADVIIGAEWASPDGLYRTGASYVVFGIGSGVSGFGADFALSSLDGTNGFRFNGVGSFEFFGTSVSSAGDVNGDGFDDIIVGAPFANPDGRLDAGETYVLFGKGAGFAASINPADLDGTNGFRVGGSGKLNYCGYSVSSAGDVNGDGFDDIVIGAPGALGNRGDSYVVFGTDAGFSASVSLASLDGANGFRIARAGPGGSDGARNGSAVSSAGDVNGDGFDDILVSAPAADADGKFNAGESYVVFGKAGGFAASVELSRLDGTDGFRMDGIDVSDRSGFSLSSAGDVNGDGYDDIIVGAVEGDPGDINAGESYVVFGKAGGFTASFDLASLDGANGFRLDGVKYFDRSGTSVSSAGDINGDGFDDVIIGARNGGPNSEGESYVVFGKADGFAASIDLDDLDGLNGFRLEGVGNGAFTGQSVSSAGDVNGDGFDDIIIGGPYAGPNGAGASYIIYGRAPTEAVTRIGAAGDQTIRGGDFDDTLRGKGGADTLIGAGGDDRLRGGGGADVFRFQNRSETGGDRITDFSHAQHDRIDLSALDADRGKGGNQSFTFIGESAFTGAAGELRSIDNGDGSFTIQGDNDRDGVADFQLLVTASTPLVAADFVL